MMDSLLAFGSLGNIALLAGLSSTRIAVGRSETVVFIFGGATDA